MKEQVIEKLVTTILSAGYPETLVDPTRKATNDYLAQNAITDLQDISVVLDVSFCQKLLLEINNALRQNGKTAEDIDHVVTKNGLYMKSWPDFVAEYKNEIAKHVDLSTIKVYMVDQAIYWKVHMHKATCAQNVIINGKAIPGKPIWWLRSHYDTLNGEHFEYIEQILPKPTAKTTWPILYASEEEKLD